MGRSSRQVERGRLADRRRVSTSAAASTWSCSGGDLFLARPSNRPALPQNRPRTGESALPGASLPGGRLSACTGGALTMCLLASFGSGFGWANSLTKLARVTGREPATSGMEGQR